MWPGEYFKRSEFACKCGCGFDTVDAELLAILVNLRRHYGQPITIHSGCRCQKHNKAVGGVINSQHLIGRAADVTVKNVDLKTVYEYLCTTYKGKYGFKLYKTFVHLDSRSGCWRDPKGS